jgi:hypothetical protein
MVWDDMLPEEQEIAKKVISEENDWIIWRVKPNRGRLGEEAEDDRTHQAATAFLGTALMTLVQSRATGKWRYGTPNREAARRRSALRRCGKRGGGTPRRTSAWYNWRAQRKSGGQARN